MKLQTSQTTSILAVEDNRDHRFLLEDALKSYGGFHATFVGSLRGMIEALEETWPEAIVLDLGLPDSRGLGTLKAALDCAANVPIIVLTADRESELGLEAVRMGAADFVPKRFLDEASVGLRIEFALERFRSRRRIEQSNTALRAFVASIGHDLRAPIRHVCRSVEAARSALPEGAEASREVLQDVPRHVARHQKLLDASLEYARHATAEPRFEMVDLSELFARVVEPFSAETRTRVTLSDPFVFLSDPHFTYLILKNLVENSLKFWSNAPSTVKVSGRSLGHAAEISVVDTGMGMREAVASHAALPGKRGPNTQSIPGSGFGLAIATMLAEAQDGALHIASEEGRGTTARLLLPHGKAINAELASVPAVGLPGMCQIAKGHA